MSPPDGPHARRRRLVLLGAVAVLVVLADQVTKSLAVSKLTGHSVHLIGPVWLRLEYNSGIAFSIGTSLTALITVLVVVVVAGVAFFARRVPTTSAALAVGLILGGAIGNLADRLFRSHHGAVVDFLYTRYWPTFNVADASVVCGCVLFAWILLRTPHGASVETEGSGPPGTTEVAAPVSGPEGGGAEVES